MDTHKITVITLSIRYLRMQLNRRQTWTNRIKVERVQLNLKLNNIIWLFGRKSMHLHTEIAVNKYRNCFIKQY